jgi:hypothetical protein
MKNTFVSTTIIAALAIPALALAVTSGLKAGEQVSAFHPTHVAGPMAGTDKCFPCTFKNRPQAQIWVNGDKTENVVALAKALDKSMDNLKGKEFKAMIVVLSDKSAMEATKTMAAKMAKDNGIKNIAIAVLPKDHEAVQAYKINLSKDVKNTVFVYRDWTVKDSMTNVVANSAGLASLEKAINNTAR